ncbi:MAG: twin-arginine translocation signal domain-containing protein [Anaerolineales bacterium]|nr:twin-arginine translocation signal domain-containing protein [Anaerolineales bacterium]
MPESTKKMNRRDFLKVAGLAVGATALSCTGLGALATSTPEITFLEKNSEGANNMNKVLIAYASKAGSTSEVAGAIAEELSAKGMLADVLQIKQVKDIGDYKAVIIGSAIRMGSWLSEATGFLETHKTSLSRIPTAFFTVCMTLHEESGENRRKVEEFMQPVRAILEPASLGLFAGKMDYSKLSFLDRQIAKMVKVPEGDFRNWDAIRSWAREIQPLLSV